MKERLYFLDTIRVALIVLVVFHHAGQPYNENGGWWYFQSLDTTGGLGKFFAVNASFFMSLFFFISAYFLPASFDRKGAKAFLADRLKRLGIPLLLGFLLIIPTLMYAYYTHFRGYAPLSFWAYFRQVFLGLGEKPADWTGPSWPDMQFGHLWFLEHLLVYALLYALWRSFFPATNRERTVGLLSISGFVILLSLATYAIRIAYPINEWVGVFGFIQTEFAHVPQYASFFLLGILAYRYNWLRTLPARIGYLWLGIGLLLAVAWYAGLGDRLPYFATGGLSYKSLLWSTVETFMCAGLCIGFLSLFREKANVQSPLFQTLAENTFTVYIIHVPVVVAMQYALGGLALSGFTKFIAASIFGVVLSFLVSQFVIRRIPFIGQILFGSSKPGANTRSM